MRRPGPTTGSLPGLQIRIRHVSNPTGQPFKGCPSQGGAGDSQAPLVLHGRGTVSTEHATISPQRPTTALRGPAGSAGAVRADLHPPSTEMRFPYRGTLNRGNAKPEDRHDARLKHRP